MTRTGGRYVAMMQEVRLTDTCYRWADPRLQAEFKKLQHNISGPERRECYERIIKIRAELTS